MAKAPAFQLYSSDFISSTQDMDAATVGVYIRLLCFQWDNRSIPDTPKKIARIAGVSDDEFVHIWADLSCKFVPDEPGRLVNPRLNGIRLERDEFIKQASVHGKNGASKRYGTPKNDNGVPYSQPNEVPQQNPNGVGIALQSPSSISIKEEKKEIDAIASNDFFSEPIINPKRSDHCPTWGEVLWQMESLKGTKEQAKEFFDYNEKKDWRNYNGQPVAYWQSMVSTWLTNDAIKKAKEAEQEQRRIDKEAEQERKRLAKIADAEQKRAEKNAPKPQPSSSVTTADSILRQRYPERYQQ